MEDKLSSSSGILFANVLNNCLTTVIYLKMELIPSTIVLYIVCALCCTFTTILLSFYFHFQPFRLQTMFYNKLYLEVRTYITCYLITHSNDFSEYHKKIG